MAVDEDDKAYKDAQSRILKRARRNIGISLSKVVGALDEKVAQMANDGLIDAASSRGIDSIKMYFRGRSIPPHLLKPLGDVLHIDIRNEIAKEINSSPNMPNWNLIRPTSQETKPITDRSVFDFKMDRRGHLARVAKHFHRAVDETPDFPLIAKQAWLPQEMTSLVRIDEHLRFLGRSQQDVEPFELPLFGGRTCAEWSRDMNREMKLGPGFSYRLISVDTEVPSLAFCGSDYLSYYNTCEALAFELAEWCVRHSGRQHEVSPIDLPRRGVPERIFDFSTRNCVVGQNTLLIFFDGPNGDVFFLHDRTSTSIAEAQNTLHVVPAGTFQPDSYAGAQPRDFSLRRAIWRELAEELLGQAEVESFAMNGEDFMTGAKLRPFIEAERNDQLKIFFLGLGLDPVTTKPEILLCIAVNARAVGIRSYEETFTDNWEGAHFTAPWSSKVLADFSTDQRMLPAGAACLTMAIRHFDKLDRLFPRG